MSASGLADTVVARLREFELTGKRVAVGLSGGRDSVVLLDILAQSAPCLGIVLSAIHVHHGLSPHADAWQDSCIAHAARAGVSLTVRRVRIRRDDPAGTEAAARAARYDCYRALDVDAVALAQHADDQAETVLLGLGRGSGPRSLAGMRAADPPWHRPLLGVRRRDTRAACAELGLTAWDDPHNTDRRFTRVRLRTEVLPLLEDVLGGGVAEALARTAAALREDTETLDAMARTELGRAAAADELAITAIADLPAALRLRVVRGWLLSGGATDLTDKQIRAVDALVTGWHGQGGVAVGCDHPRTRLFAERRGGLLVLRTEPV